MGNIPRIAEKFLLLFVENRLVAAEDAHAPAVPGALADGIRKELVQPDRQVQNLVETDIDEPLPVPVLDIPDEIPSLQDRPERKAVFRLRLAFPASTGGADFLSPHVGHAVHAQIA